VGIREIVRGRWGGRLSKAMGAINARHPWSHNDHFHPWILTRLPKQRHRAVDVGCGRGELLAALAPQFEDVRGTDVDTTMREAAATRCAGLANVTVDDTPLDEVTGPVDLVTMVAVLHHLDIEKALSGVRRVLAPGGRFLSVGLARPASLTDHAWDLASMVTNPAIGYVKHPWVSPKDVQPPSVPVADPRLTYAEIGLAVERVMPGARMRHHLGFRHTIEWTKP
jgi:SAM-dependent methyltransferase